jgi:WD repeat-containing protein 53
VKAISSFNKNPVQLVAWAPPKCPISSSLWAACGRDLYCFDIRGSDEVIVRDPILMMNDVCEQNDDDDEISCINVSPKNGDFVVAADDAGLVHVLNIKRAANTAQFELERGPSLRAHTNVVTGVQCRPTTLRDIISGSLDGTLIGWDISKPNKPVWCEEMGNLEPPNSSAQSLNPPLVHSISMHNSGRYFAAGLGDGTISVHAFSKTQQPIGRLVGGHSTAIAQVHFPGFDHQLLVSAGNDKKVSFWQLESMLDNRSKATNAMKERVDTVEGPHCRLAHSEKINWLASSTTSSNLHVADVSPVITVFDVSRI